MPCLAHSGLSNLFAEGTHVPCLQGVLFPSSLHTAACPPAPCPAVAMAWDFLQQMKSIPWHLPGCPLPSEWSPEPSAAQVPPDTCILPLSRFLLLLISGRTSCPAAAYRSPGHSHTLTQAVPSAWKPSLLNIPSYPSRLGYETAALGELALPGPSVWNPWCFLLLCWSLPGMGSNPS